MPSTLLYRHVRQLESDLRPSSSYLDLATSQNRIRPAMRGILLSWLSEVAMQFELGPGCLLLASSLLDRYLSKWPVGISSVLIEKCAGSNGLWSESHLICSQETSRCTLQMLGTCCLMIAAKYDETVYPSASQFVEMANDSFTKKQLLACERHVLEAVGYRIYAPVASNILQTYKELLWPSTQDCISAADEIQSRVILLATYLVEVATMEYKMLKYLPSTVAAAAIAVASDALGMPLAMKEADFLVALAAPGMWQAANDLLALHVTAYNVHDEDVSSPFLAIKEKYSLALWGSVACIAPANPLAVASWERSDSVTGALVPCGSQDRMRHLYVGETSVINSS